MELEQEPWSRKKGSQLVLCARCGKNPPKRDRRICRRCISDEAAEYRARVLAELGDGEPPPCVRPDCDDLRYVTGSQVSSYCRVHHLEARRVIRIRHDHGISAEEYDELLAAGNGCCPICLRLEKLVLDHCHASGKRRGAICDDCNLGLGRFRDDVAALQRAIDYLTR